MPLKKGTTTIGAIYKGTTPIVKVYKGTTLVFSAYTFADWYETFVYNTIIPSTISSSTVKDNGTMKLKKIEGNGAIVNQQIDFDNVSFGNSTSGNASLTKDNTTKTLTLTCTTAFTQQNKVNIDLSYVPVNHKVLLIYDILSTISYTLANDSNVFNNATYLFGTSTSVIANQKMRVLQAYTTSTGSDTWRIGRGPTTWAIGDTISISNVMYIDLTLMFGTGNEPTTISDNRIQKILNSGYIEYSTGSYANSEVEEIEVSKLPAEYQEVEYIESTGTQYIDTNYIPNLNTKIETKFYSGQRTTTQMLFGCKNTSSNYYQFYKTASGIIFRFSLNFGVDDPLLEALNLDDNTFENKNIKLICDKNNLILNGTSYSYSTTPYSNGYNSLGIFARHNPSDWSLFGSFKLYSFKIYDNGTLVRNFVPCYRKSDSVIGLYDLVNGVFYTNAGTGTFVKGNDVVSTKITLPNKVQLNGSLNAHDTFEVSSNGYVFTKNVGSVDLGSQTWTNISGNIWRNASRLDTIYVSTTTKANIITAKYITDTYSNVSSSTTNNTICVRDGDRCIYVYGTSITQASDITGTLYYELATPQTITIPKKHLGSVDLGSLDWGYSNGYFISGYSLVNVRTDVRTNIYCFMYITATSVGTNMGITLASNGRVRVNNDKYGTDTTAFKQAMQGVILFYETNSEVANPILSKTFNVGGSITTDSDVLPNLTIGVQVL